ncbi:MAG: spore coat associated protein CotJA [Clostridia bacterium]|nr:spore coat associated protein CotJA [Clostridia bacterium]
MENLCLDSLPVGYAYVPMQKFRMLYPADTALMYGTLFEELNMPVGEYGHD